MSDRVNRCIDNQPHDFRYLKEESERVEAYAMRRTFDVFYCTKCLAYQRVETTCNAR